MHWTVQCDVGHVVCSTCSDKLRAAGKCYLCGVAMAGGYRRCHAMESVVEFVRGPCPNAPYGCVATPAYHGREEHILACPHVPCHCPGEACAFVGHTAAMLDHIAGAHGWPCTPVRARRSPFVARLSGLLQASFSARLRTGFNFVVLTDEDDKKYLFLMNVTHHLFCSVVSVICIRPRGEAETVKEIRFVVSYRRFWSNDQLISHDQRTMFRVASSDLSDGLPDSNGRHQLIVPTTCVHGDNGGDMKVTVEISMDQTTDQ